MNKLGGRKYVLVWFFAICGTTLQFIDKLDGTYISLATLLTAVYGAANVANKRISK